MLKFSVAIKPDAYIKLNYKLIYTSPAMIIVIAAAVVVVLGTVTKSGFNSGQLLSAGVLLPVCFLVYLLLILPVTFFYRIRGMYYRMAALNEPQQYTVDESGVVIKGKTFSVKNEWAAYKYMQVKHGWLILWKAKNFGNFIPLHSFTSEESLKQFITIAKEKGVKAKGRDINRY